MPSFSLFFSVKTSGLFVGVAEMVGPIDFNKSLDYWQQDKWVGYFPVKLEKGLQMIKVFKDHSSKRCILDDFEFYEEQQKRIQEKKAKQQLQKQVSNIVIISTRRFLVKFELYIFITIFFKYRIKFLFSFY
ncbi:putative YTH domain-containing protein [Helianthus anomalus]